MKIALQPSLLCALMWLSSYLSWGGEDEADQVTGEADSCNFCCGSFHFSIMG